MGSDADVLVIVDGTVIDGTGTRRRPNGSIVVRDKTIAEVNAPTPLGRDHAPQ
jgi:hypothetical protein